MLKDLKFYLKMYCADELVNKKSFEKVKEEKEVIESFIQYIESYTEE